MILNLTWKLDSLTLTLLRFCDGLAQGEDHFGDIDFHGAPYLAPAAGKAGISHRGGFFEVLGDGAGPDCTYPGEVLIPKVTRYDY